MRSSPKTVIQRKNIKLKFLDGLRGLAALYVVLDHCYFKVMADHPPAWASILTYGKFAVDIFIVLSGFLLMLPVATSVSKTMEGGIGPYLQRRALRILPPYFCALVYSCLLILAGSMLSGKLAGRRSMIGDLAFGPLVSHLFLVHNLVPDWSNRINAPLWSVATEWQIYFIFPLLLLPVWRKIGLWGVMGIAMVMGIIPALARLPWAQSAESWLLVLFAMGLTGAVLFSRMIELPEDAEQIKRQSRAWGISGLIISAGVIATLIALPDLYYSWRWILDCFVGSAATCLILYCAPAAYLPQLAKPLPLRLLESRFALWIGMFSYSLYLTHGPLLAVINAVIKSKLHLSVTGNLLILVFLGTPICLAFGYIFYLMSERPFLRKRQGVTPIAVPEMALAPAAGSSATSPD